MTIKTKLLLPLFILFLIVLCYSSKSQDTIAHKIKNIETDIFSLTKAVDSSGQYSVIFSSKENRSEQLTMLVGKDEAQTLAIEIKKIKHESPLPLDLFEDAIIKTGFIITKVNIDSLVKNIYTAKITFSNGDKIFELKARPVDAATIALKFNCPIFINEALLSKF